MLKPARVAKNYTKGSYSRLVVSLQAADPVVKAIRTYKQKFGMRRPTIHGDRPEHK